MKFMVIRTIMGNKLYSKKTLQILGLPNMMN